MYSTDSLVFKDALVRENTMKNRSPEILPCKYRLKNGLRNGLKKFTIEGIYKFLPFSSMTSHRWKKFISQLRTFV